MNTNIEVLRELDELVEAARLLGATQAKKLFGCHTDEDRRFERAMYESIDKHRAALLDWEAKQPAPQQPAAVGVDANELTGVRARLKSGDFDGADVMRAWLAIDKLLAQQPAAVDEAMVELADRIAASSHPDDPRLEVAYSIARYLSLGWPAAHEDYSETFAAGRLEGLSIAAAECDRLTTALDYAGKEYRRPAGADQCARAIRTIYAKHYRELHPDPQKMNELSGNSGQLPAAAQPGGSDNDH